MKKNDKKIFMIINLGYFGDVIAASALCDEIKQNYPDSTLLFLVTPPCVVIAKNIPGVDYAYAFEKRGAHKGLLGMIKFIFSFKHWGNVDYCFMLHSSHRGNILAFLLGAKRRITCRATGLTQFLVTDLYPFKKGEIDIMYVPSNFANHMNFLTGKPPVGKMCFDTPKSAVIKASEILKESGYDKYELVGLSTCSRLVEKDWNAKDAADFIKRVNESGRRVVYTGTNTASKMAEEIRALGVVDFLDLSDKTTILEMAGIIQLCKAFVSVDTGSMHLSAAMKKPTLALFFLNWIDNWAPQDLSTNSVLLNPQGISGEECFEELGKLLAKI